MMTIEDAMMVGSSRYAGALEVLRRLRPAAFTQTGGMSAALQLPLERGYLLITDAADSLPWNRDHLIVWGVGYHPTQDTSEGPEVFFDWDDTSVEALAGLVRRALREVATARREDDVRVQG